MAIDMHTLACGQTYPAPRSTSSAGPGYVQSFTSPSPRQKASAGIDSGAALPRVLMSGGDAPDGLGSNVKNRSGCCMQITTRKVPGQ